MGQFGVGQGLARIEDLRLLRGEGRYMDDVNLDGQAHAVFVRSPHAHAEIIGIDLEQDFEQARLDVACDLVCDFAYGRDVIRDGLGHETELFVVAQVRVVLEVTDDG